MDEYIQASSILADIISCAVWLCYRFNLSHRDIEGLLAEHAISVSREATRLWCMKFGAICTRRLKRKHQGFGDTFYIDEVFGKINGKRHYLWRAVGQESLSHEVLRLKAPTFGGYGEVVDVYLQARRDGAAAKRFFKRLLRSHGSEHRKIVTD
ncbi:MAG: DDE-type integrase/transposase/recombinase [Halioglobus sp.]